jgi:hypothetical protein
MPTQHHNDITEQISHLSSERMYDAPTRHRDNNNERICKNDAETDKKMSDVIGTLATDEIVVQMFSEHFVQDTFKSDFAEAVINTYYKDAEVVPTSNRLVYTHNKLFNDS